MPVSSTADLVPLIEAHAQPITGVETDYDPLMEPIGDAHFVLLGEATHGTHEFYRMRAELSRRLILERGFNALAVEADWPDAYRVNRYVRHFGDDHSPEDALADFKRFPLWMWRNLEVVDLIRWLREHNDGRHHGRKVGFYGLDLYSLFTSIQAVISSLKKMDPAAAERARGRYSCFEHFAENSQEYGIAASLRISPDCEEEAIEQLIDLRAHAAEYLRRDGFAAQDELFFVEQNARLVENAEQYYREMFRGRVSTWNLRDRHMAQTLQALAEHLQRTTGQAKIIVWEHNSHIGDARATDMGAEGEVNVGQLTRERYGDDAKLIGFTTYTGRVAGASNWGDPVQHMRVRPALSGSIEALFHECALPAFSLLLREHSVRGELDDPMLERAIGVVYRPDTERASHYFHCSLARQFDVVIHVDETRALQPLDATAAWQHSEVPETFPTGL